MVDKVIIDDQEVKLTADLFEPIPAQTGDNEAITRPSMTFWQDARKRLFKNPGAVVGLVILVSIVLMAIFAPMFSKFDYKSQNIRHVKVPPKMPIVSALGVMNGKDSKGVDVYAEKNIDETYLFGTDSLGRDIWTRVWTGARVSLFIAVLAAIFDLIIGVSYGGISAYYGGRVDIIMQRIMEVITGIPSLVVVTLFIMVFNPGIVSIALAMAVSGWTGMARVVRSHVLRLKNQEFILASKTLGSSDIRLILKHLFPNVIGPIVVMIMFTLPSAIFYEAFLSFIGLGLQPPDASLGVLINEGFQALQNYPYMMFIPSTVVCLLIFSLNLLADGLRDAVDPKMRNQ
ncbi:ABC transporter permease [Romboutsia sedimentorum]|uniref:oligopeptide ABC transporter permease n=1 Tax=Romboutsia sedimentorum TaxID=1368474 RepID=UPI0024DEDC17|nr:oligopeptide ABC transporter permease [Romboutsia sedimentorum]MDK2585904.1 ABC transporter permease [Romboutsia sedimentorum]